MTINFDGPISNRNAIVATYMPGKLPGWKFTGGGRPDIFREVPENWKGTNIDLVLQLARNAYPGTDLIIAWTAGCYVLIDMAESRELKRA